MAIAEVRCLRTACGKPSTSELAEAFGKALERTQAFVRTCSADRCFEAESRGGDAGKLCGGPLPRGGFVFVAFERERARVTVRASPLARDFQRIGRRLPGVGLAQHCLEVETGVRGQPLPDRRGTRVAALIPIDQGLTIVFGAGHWLGFTPGV